MPGLAGEPVVTLLVCFLFFAHKAAGALTHPAFPAPSLHEGKLRIPRAILVAGMLNRVIASGSEAIRRRV